MGAHVEHRWGRGRDAELFNPWGRYWSRSDVAGLGVLDMTGGLVEGSLQLSVATGVVSHLKKGKEAFARGNYLHSEH